MRVWMTAWERIRENFSEEEKRLLNSAIVGEMICPKGLELNEEKLPWKLELKLKRLLANGH